MNGNALLEWSKLGFSIIAALIVGYWAYFRWRAERKDKQVSPKSIFIDTRRLLEENGEKREYRYASESTISDLLDDIWHDLSQGGIELRPFAYGEDWVLKLGNGTFLREAGAIWARKRRVDRDDRNLKEVGIESGTTIVPLKKI